MSLGPDHRHVGMRLNNLAQLLKDTDHLNEVEPLLRRALAIYETSVAPDHSDTAILLAGCG